MTVQPNSFSNHPLHFRAITTCAMVIAAWFAATCHRCAAQYVSYPNGYPVTSYPANHSYPAGNSYPISHNFPANSYPQAQSYPSQSYPQTQSYPSSTSPSARVIESPSRGVPNQPGRAASVQQQSGIRSGTRPDRIARLASTTVPDSRYSMRDGTTIRSNTVAISPYAPSRIESARESALQLRRFARSSTEITSKLASENAGFAEQWVELADTYVTLANRVANANEKLAATRSDLDDVNDKLTRYGLTPTIGMLLRDKREQLDAWQVHDSQTLMTSQQLGRSRQQQLELEMVQYDGSDPVGQASQIFAAAGIETSTLRRSELETQVQKLLRQRRQWIDLLQKGYQDYQQKLGELDSATTASADLIRQYRQLIDRQITWIRSGDPVSFRDVRNLKGGMAALFDSRRSADFGPALEGKLRSNAAGGIGLVVALMLLLAVRWRAKSWLVGIGGRTRMREATADSRKVAAGLLSIVVAFAFPAMLYAIARWLGAGVVSESTLHASAGFYAASLVTLVIELPRQLLRSGGYVDKHVDVDLPDRVRATRYLTLLGFGLVVAAYAVTVMGLIDHGMWRNSVSRFGFVSAMLIVTWMMHLGLRPKGGILEPMIARFGGVVIHRVRLMIYLVGIGFPLALAALSALGYGFTAGQLLQRTIITLVAGMIAATLWAGIKILSSRAWMMLTGTMPPPRQFDEYGEIESARGAAVSGKLGEHNLELKHQLAFLCQCSLIVVAIASFGWLWIDIFPNVRMGNPVVWTVQDIVTTSSVDASGKTIVKSAVESTPITALHLVLAAATLFVAFQLSRLLPALYDALVLQRVSFDEGMEHFTYVLGRCLLFGVGCLIAFRLIGVRWQTIQWLAVGLTIGLGFGLQDLVRNLYGGLVVLFERPAGLGDLISVGKVTGRVSHQRLRTTVLSDDEGREVIVPNKSFVNEDVVNWMGAGRLSVVPIEVAVTRDKRPLDVCRTLQELVVDQPQVLISPAPQATLVCVGRSSQRIEIRAWIEESEDANRFRDQLLGVVRGYLREKRMLVDSQPPQPAIPDPDAQPTSKSYRSPRRNRRSA